MIDLDELTNTITILETWIRSENFKGWDPFDALNSPILRRLTGNNRRIGQVFVQVVKNSPINFRPLFGISKGYNPKGMGLFLSTYIRKYRVSRLQEHFSLIEFFANWLDQNKTITGHGAGWGYNFDWPNRGFFAPAGTPTLVNTAFIGLSFLGLYDLALQGLLPENSIWNGSKALDIAVSACNFVINDLNCLKDGDNQICFSYTPLDHRFVHNANVLGAWLLAETFNVCKDQSLAGKASAAARFTISHQGQDGSWRYGIDRMDNWIDNFHTGFVLTGVKRTLQILNIHDFDELIRRGYFYWKNQFSSTFGNIKYFQDKSYPIDIHSISQTILTGLCFLEDDPTALEMVEKVYRFGLDHFQAKEGFFYYQKTPAYTIKIPYMRWSQAWMFWSLTELEHQVALA